ncbi:MAG: ribbon-helix-helix domain-containing protein [Inquilinus sp.]|nr:ribbon-helix-helix domain-containing protein [Inquilinus sp.]
MAVEKRSVLVSGHHTSVSLEPEFWAALKEAAAARGISLNRLVTEIDEKRESNLSSALRVFALAEARRRDQLAGLAEGDGTAP